MTDIYDRVLPRALAKVTANAALVAEVAGAIDNPMATSVVTTTGRITIHFRRQMTDA